MIFENELKCKRNVILNNFPGQRLNYISNDENENRNKNIFQNDS